MKNKIKKLGLMLMILLGNIAFAGSNPVDSQLMDAWTLKEFVIISPNGQEAAFCGGVTGLIIYEKSGHMSVSINCGPQDPIRVPADDYGRQLFYAGRFQIRGSDVAHKITNASSSSLIGKELVRKVEVLTDKVLVLTGPFGSSGQHLRIVWQR